jgi:hypothetical protein
MRNRPKYGVYLWDKSMPGAVRSKALICSRFSSGVAGANPTKIISSVCCVGIGLSDRLTNLTELSYRKRCVCVCVCVCVCHSENYKTSRINGSQIGNIINTAAYIN